ncbi:MAG TPA: TetR/AcrR family transcriptional regulator [Porticoccaceae bacterium]
MARTGFNSAIIISAERPRHGKPVVKQPRKVGAENSKTRTAIMKATEQLMLDKGYAAVSTRQVAKLLDLTPALIHYYFPTTDDLLVAILRHTADKAIAAFRRATRTRQPLQALWSFGMDKRSTALTVEFMAMANHRPAIRKEIANIAPLFRQLQAEALAQHDFARHGIDVVNPMSISVLMIAVSRLLVIEGGLGISMGHDEIRAFMDYWVETLERSQTNT